MDTVSAARRSANMRQIRSKNTAPELAVRSFLHRQGLRYRVHDSALPGCPDLVFASRRVCIFVHGCFWHGCSKCRAGRRRVRSNVSYWTAKIAGNKKRDARNVKALKAAGWHVFQVWACEAAETSALKHLSRRIMKRKVSRSRGAWHERQLRAALITLGSSRVAMWQSSNLVNVSRPGAVAVDLFSGAGGLTLGLLKAGFDVRLCADISSVCGATHSRNFPRIPFLNSDVTRLSGREVLDRAGLKRGQLDLLIGGPPCQGFSILGRREVDDPRNGLFGQFLRIAFEIRPKVVVIENVPGLATLNGGAILKEIGQAFAKARYRVDCAELLAAQYGVPQMRWRMFFVAWRDDLGISSAGFPQPTHGRRGIGDLVPNRTISPEDMHGFLTIRDAISDLPPIMSGELGTVYQGRPKTAYQHMLRQGMRRELFNHYAPRMSPINLARIDHLEPGDDWRNLPRRLLPAGMQRALRKDHTRRFRRMTWDGVARSIITRFRDPKSGEYIHPDQRRTISIREAARIQSFPDWFEFMGGFSDQYEQVGNAVPPLLAEAVAKQLLNVLDGMYTNHGPVKSRYKIVA